MAGRSLRALERATRRGRTCRARKALARDPRLSGGPTRKALLSYLLGRDLGRIRDMSWERRLVEFLERIMSILARADARRSLWLVAVAVPLWSLELGRAQWGAGRPLEAGLEEDARELLSGLRDEDVLGLVLASTVATTALYRLHLILWGPPEPPLGRRYISRLRRSWLPFCALEPTERVFPPLLPSPMRKTLSQEPGSSAKGLCMFWVRWLHRGDEASLERLLQGLIVPQGAP